MYVPLHVHSEYSLLDGAIRLDALAKHCRDLGLPACALTDHGNLHGAVEFHDACAGQGVKPILGMEAYVAPSSRFDRASRSGLAEAGHHLILLARDDEGWHNLMRLASLAQLEGFYYKPRIDKELLARHSRGITGLSACLSGEIAGALLRGDEGAAKQAAGGYADILGKGHFFLEVQDHGLPEQARVNAGLAQLSRDLGLPLVATPDCHYLHRADAASHEVLLCIQTATSVNDPKRMRFGTEEFYLKDEAEMRKLFAWAPSAVDATVAVAEQCNVTLPKAALRLPAFDLPAGVGSALEHLRGLCQAALPAKYPQAGADVVLRLDHELKVIAKLGYEGYFLIVADFIQAARRLGVRVGPGRGSAGGSLVSYLLGITAVEPLSRGLLFERFLNPERVSPPDIDVDFADRGREKVIDYVVQKYGRDRVAQIMAFGRLAARAAVRDVGRALDYGYGEVDALAKQVPAEPDMTLTRALEQNPELKAMAQEPRAARLLETARSLEGLARHASTHAAGVVIGVGPLIDEVPLSLGHDKDAGPGVVTQFDMASLERIGLVKMDFLGLRTLTVLDEACRLIKAAGGQEPDLDALPDADPATFALLAKGESHGVFQLESWGMRDLLKRFKPRNLEDIDQLIALFRPGPMRMIDEYIKRREGSTPVRYDLPQLKPILERTYGVIVYQEQVMRVAMEVAGFSAGQADLLRRAMGKKDPELLEKQRQSFVAGAKGVDPEAADKLFDLLARFAEYGFNKAHSAAYAVLAYQTAWLKAHHPAAFLAALMSSELGSPERAQAALAECRRLGVAVLGPDVNASDAYFSLEAGALRFGLAAVRHVGVGAMEALVRARQAGPFASVEDLFERCDASVLNAKAAEALVKAGALDSLAGGSGGRAGLLAGLAPAIERAHRAREEKESGQGSLFGAEAPPTTPAAPAGDLKALAWDELQRLAFEKEALGFYLSGHPLGRWQTLLKALRCAPLDSLAEGRDGAPLRVGGVVLGVKMQMTKKGEAMARLTLEDLSGVCEAIVWPRVLESARALAAKDAQVFIRGRLDQSGDEARVSADELIPLDQALSRVKGLHVHLDAAHPHAAARLKDWARARAGTLPLWLHLRDGKSEVVQKAGVGVALNQEGLDELVELHEDAWVE